MGQLVEALEPAGLFDWLAGVAPTRKCAWDAGTGNGQCAVALGDRFERVIATDPSAAQLAAAETHPSVSYRCERAETPSLDDGEADLVTVAQALHWFDVPTFSAAAARVLAPGGVLAVWCYEVFATAPAIDAVVSHFYHHVIGPYWPPERRHIESGYAGLVLPFERIPTGPSMRSWATSAPGRPPRGTATPKATTRSRRCTTPCARCGAIPRCPEGCSGRSPSTRAASPAVIGSRAGEAQRACTSREPSRVSLPSASRATTSRVCAQPSATPSGTIASKPGAGHGR